jgi:putative endonuclease
MRNEAAYFVYILSNTSKTLYVGVTNDRLRRLAEHRSKAVSGFSARYNLTRLVYYEETSDIAAAIAREKQIKGWLRMKKIALIESANPHWKDLAADWFSPHDSASCHPERSEGSRRLR